MMEYAAGPPQLEYGAPVGGLALGSASRWPFKARHGAPLTKPMRLRGYATKWRVPFVAHDQFWLMERRAGMAALSRAPDVRFLFDHDGPSFGSTHDGRLWLLTDEVGLAFELVMADDPDSGALYRKVATAELSQMSIGGHITYRTQSIAGEPVRVIHDLDLSEISIVSYPAVKNTCVHAVAADDRSDLITAMRYRDLAHDGAANVLRKRLADVRRVVA